AIIILRYATRNPYIQQLGQSYLTLFVVNIIGSVLIPGISLAGHIGGAVGGAFLAIIFPVQGERRMYSASQRLVALVLFVGLAVLLLYRGMGL
ncbi:MAG: rhomboid family intramembrane serine protease, partial [Streptococcus thermophilus]|nr:rhomboid family intramembrane serine protease [Streptococcus thermophilus]